MMQSFPSHPSKILTDQSPAGHRSLSTTMPTTTSTPVGLAQTVARPAPRRSTRASAAKLYDVPVSNNGARVRIALYAKGLVPDRVEIVSPSELGGIKSEEYMALQPKGQMPLLVTESGLPIWESEVILGYVLDKYDGEGPSFTLDTAEERALSTLSTKVFDTFIQPVQGCMYRKSPSAEQRAAELKVIDENLHILESLCSADGPYFVGGRPCKVRLFFPSFRSEIAFLTDLSLFRRQQKDRHEPVSFLRLL